MVFRKTCLSVTRQCRAELWFSMGTVRKLKTTPNASCSTNSYPASFWKQLRHEAELPEKAAVSCNSHSPTGTQQQILSLCFLKFSGVTQTRNYRVTSLTCVSGKLLNRVIKNRTLLYLKDYLIGSNQQFLQRQIMS